MKLLTTPIGTALYPKLVKPDTKFDEVGSYSCKLILSKDDFETVSAQINPWFDQEYERFVRESRQTSLKRREKLPLRINEDNEYELFSKQIAQKNVAGKLITFQIALFDSAGKKINDDLNIGSGSKVRLSVEPFAWHVPAQGVGYTLRLKAAQIIDLKEYTPKSDAFSFDAHEGGFVSEDLGDAFENDSTDKDASIPF